MSSTLPTILSLPPYHLLAYGTLLGTELYQTFVMTGVSFRALPISMFTTLQKRVFPAYFRTQTLLAAATALTYPPGSLVGLRQQWSSWVPLLVNLACAGLNLYIYGPRTTRAMIDRIHQETRDGKKYNDTVDQSAEMKRLNRQFSKSHAMSIHLNLIAIIGTVWYGIMLAQRLDVRSV
ncbi:hypothetical protein BD410DRAFT_844909 [Rickenella mellea]|uniref:TMEM205-like domain-containing protein n=1 Tax=Rickenella mellea TaxID=50990 RepID=A0A4Y7PK22_9AGAM|nr:hypothetical protein BD410DRAFT_844909 [Rickenella mellea]